MSATRDLGKIFSCAERQLAWPWQMYEAWVALLPKEQGGKRPIILLPMLYRLWSLIRKEAVSQWSQEKAGFWDAAVKRGHRASAQ